MIAGSNRAAARWTWARWFLALGGLLLACASDRLVRPAGPLPASPAVDQLVVRFVKFDLGDSSPAAHVRVSNNGQQLLGLVTVSPIRYLRGRTGWIGSVVTMDADSNGASIALTPSYSGTVQTAADSAEFEVAAAGGDSARLVTVTGQLFTGAELGFSAQRLTFGVDTGATGARQGIVNVLNIGNGSLGAVSHAVSPPKPWLELGPSATPGFFVVTVTPGGQSDSTFVRFSGPSIRQPDSIAVILSVGNPKLAVTPPPNFIGVVDAEITQPSGGSVKVAVIKQGSGDPGFRYLDPPRYTSASGAGWLSDTLVGDTIRFTATVGTRRAGVYNAVVTLHGSGGGGISTDIPLQMIVNPAPPRLVLSARSIDFDYVKVDCTGVPATWDCVQGTPFRQELRMYDLGGLSWTVGPAVYPPGEPSGWLTVLPFSTLPVRVVDAFTLVPPFRSQLDAMVPGDYSAKVPITAVSGLTDTVTVRLHIRSGQPPVCDTCHVTTAGLLAVTGKTDYLVYSSFGSAPAVDTVTFFNQGTGGSLGTVSRGSVQYAPGQPTGWLTASTLTVVNPNLATMTVLVSPSGLPEGGYQASVTATSSVLGARVFVVRLSVLPPPVYSLVPDSMILETGQSRGLFLKNVVGGGRASFAQLGSVIYKAGDPSGWVDIQPCCDGDLVIIGAPLSTGAIAVGTYTARLPVTLVADPPTTAPSASDTLVITLVRPPAPKPAILRLGTDAVTLGGIAGTANSIVFNVPAFNSGSGLLGGLSADPPVYNPTGSRPWLTVTPGATGLVLAADPAGLQPDSTYQARVFAHASNADSAVSLDVSVRLSQPVNALSIPVLAFSVDTLRILYSRASGTSALTSSLVVADSMRSTIPLAGLGVGRADYVSGTGWVVGAFLSSTTGPATVTVAVKARGLADGDYVAALPVSSTTPGVASRWLPVRLTVGP